MGLFSRKRQSEYIDDIDNEEEEDEDTEEKGIFRGGDKITEEDMIIMDILDNEW